MRERKAQMAEPKDRISLQIGDELELKFHAGGGQKYTRQWWKKGSAAVHPA